MLEAGLRAPLDRVLRPIGRGLARIGFTPDVLTILGILAAIGAAGLVANGEVILAIVAGFASGIPDMLDGAVARHGEQSSVRGSFFDSVGDRFSDLVMFFGVAFYLADDSAYLPLLAVGVGVAGLMVSYIRAKAESLGFVGKGGLMERTERLIGLFIGLVFDILVPVLWVMLVLTIGTVIYRFWNTWRQAPRPPRYSRMERRTRFAREPGRMSHWWRENMRSPDRPSRRRSGRRSRQ